MLKKTPDAVAGSISNLSSTIGIIAPKSPATRKLMITATKKIILKSISKNIASMMLPPMQAKINPLNPHSNNSRKITLPVLEGVMSFDANAITVTVMA